MQRDFHSKSSHQQGEVRYASRFDSVGRSRSASFPLRVVPAPRRSRSAELLRLRARLGVAAFGVLCGLMLLGGKAEKAQAQMSGGWVLDHYDKTGANLTQANPYIASIVGVGIWQDVSGSVQAVYRWQPPFFNPNQTPPEYVSFLVSASVNNFATAYGFSTPSPAGLPSHETKEIVSGSAWGKDALIVVDATKSSANANKTEYVVAKVDGNFVKSPVIECKGRAEILGGRGSYQGMAQVFLSASISAPDKSNVIITSAYDDSYHKSDDGSLPAADYKDGVKPANGPYIVRNKREDNGSMKVDTVASFNPGFGNYSTAHILKAVPIGSWPLMKFYTWSGDASPTTSVNASPDEAIAGELLVSESNLPKEYNSQVLLQATNNNQLSAGNFYKVRVHAPGENWVENTETNTNQPQTIWGSLPGMVTNGQPESTQELDGEISVWVEPSEFRCAVALSSGEWTIVGVAVTVDTGLVAHIAPVAILANPIAGTALGAGASILGYSVSSSAAQSEVKVCVNNSANWQQAVQSTRDAINLVPGADARISPVDILDQYTDVQLNQPWATNSAWKSCEMVPWVKRTHSYHFFRGDEYDAHGYVGPARMSIYSPTQAPEVVGYYEYKGSLANP